MANMDKMKYSDSEKHKIKKKIEIFLYFQNALVIPMEMAEPIFYVFKTLKTFSLLNKNNRREILHVKQERII